MPHRELSRSRLETPNPRESEADRVMRGRGRDPEKPKATVHRAKDLASTIRELVNELNQAVRGARAEGVEVELDMKADERVEVVRISLSEEF